MMNSFWIMVVIQIGFVVTYLIAKFTYRFFSRIKEAKNRAKILNERISKLVKK